jgi:hypothetical protein
VHGGVSRGAHRQLLGALASVPQLIYLTLFCGSATCDAVPLLNLLLDFSTCSCVHPLLLGLVGATLCGGHPVLDRLSLSIARSYLGQPGLFSRLGCSCPFDLQQSRGFGGFSSFQERSLSRLFLPVNVWEIDK